MVSRFDGSIAGVVVHVDHGGMIGDDGADVARFSDVNGGEVWVEGVSGGPDGGLGQRTTPGRALVCGRTNGTEICMTDVSHRPPYICFHATLAITPECGRDWSANPYPNPLCSLYVLRLEP
jgi:hypothetical protein